MTISMTAKHQITIPKVITDALGLHKGSLFDVRLKRNKIELVPVEVIEKVFTDEEYAKMDKIVEKEKGLGKKVTDKFIADLKEGIVG